MADDVMARMAYPLSFCRAAELASRTVGAWRAARANGSAAGHEQFTVFTLAQQRGVPQYAGEWRPQQQR